MHGRSRGNAGRVGAMAIAFAEGSMVTGRPPGFHEAGGP